MAGPMGSRPEPPRGRPCIRRIGGETRGGPVSGPSGPFPSRCPCGAPGAPGAPRSSRGLPLCACSSAGPCTLRFTHADRPETAVNPHQVFPQVVQKRTTGGSAASKTDLQAYRPTLKVKEWKEWEKEGRGRILVLGGCRHKLVCVPAPCNFFTSA
uniref:Protein X n=1 Tax=Hepatitis B virus TaxID=10407 RepID=A0A067YV02_HBV|nr:X protein [Hepatitis B virus]